MRFVDSIKIRVCSGKGGDGIVSWLRLKYIPKGGPAGGDGGRGGDVYIRGVKDIEVLRKYAGLKELKAQNGKDGQRRSKKGVDGEDLILDVPVGTVASFNNKKIDIVNEGELIKILDGGKGGLGNERFKSSTNTAPKIATEGKPGNCAELHLDLQIIADIGIIGKPNAGKSTFLNSVTNSKAKVADYAFTTLEPNLGVFDKIVLADIPGLIEGASKGKGLGIKFLKHALRTKMLLHFISCETEDPCQDYRSVREELKTFDEAFLDKKEIVVLSKIDLCSDDEIKDKLDLLRKCTNKEVCSLSVNDNKSIDNLKKVVKSLSAES